MDLKKIKEMLYENGLENVESISDNYFTDKEYESVFGCDLVLNDSTVPIIVAIPTNWCLKLVDIYIRNHKDFPYIPHIEKKGKICLFELEGILIDNDIYGIILQSIERAKEVLIKGLSNENNEDFIKEFDSYWGLLPNCKMARLNVINNYGMGHIKYATKYSKKNKNEKSFSYIRRKKLSPIYISDDAGKLENRGEIKKGIYVEFEAKGYIMPPDWRKKITTDYINGVLQHIEGEGLYKLIGDIGRDKMLAFKVKQPNHMIVYLGLLLTDSCFVLEDGQCKIIRAKEIIPLVLNRVDKSYLTARSSNSNNIIEDKSILLIGCGSLGGYVVEGLAKAGVEQITLVDMDRLKDENVYRHILGLEYVGQYKCVALRDYLLKNMTDMDIITFPERIEDIIGEEIDVSDYDLIVSSSGNHNVNRWINNYIHSNKIKVSVIYAWNEVLGIGNHVAYINTAEEGCFDCFMGRDIRTDELYDCTSYCLSGQTIAKKLGGCGSTFVPYASTTSLKTAYMCIETIKKVFEDRYIENVIISSKGDDYYFTKAGLKVSEKYLNQKHKTQKYTGSIFKIPSCGVCGGIE